jgi:hypothetical protein
MTPFTGVSHGADTDYLGLAVEGPDGQKFKDSWGPLNLRKSANPMNWNHAAPPISIPNDPSARFTFAVAVVNKGASDAQKILSAITNAVAEVAQTSDNPFIAIGGWLTRLGVAPVLANCDMALFVIKQSYTGTELASLAGKDGWSPEAGNSVQRVFDFGGPNVNGGKGGADGMISNVPGGCDKAVHYNIQLHIARQ